MTCSIPRDGPVLFLPAEPAPGGLHVLPLRPEVPEAGAVRACLLPDGPSGHTKEQGHRQILRLSGQRCKRETFGKCAALTAFLMVACIGTKMTIKAAKRTFVFEYGDFQYVDA